MEFLKRLIGKRRHSNEKAALSELALDRIRFLLKTIPLREHMSEAGINQLVQHVLDDVTLIERSAHPAMAVRLALADRALALANYQVIVMEPEPTPDPTGLRAMGGVTGQIKPRVFDLFKAAPEIEQEAMRIPAENYAEAWNVSLLKYWQSLLHAEVLNTIRTFLVGEVEANSKRDWYRPFLHASCIIAEQRYRDALRLPSALPVENPINEIQRYQTFLEFVLSNEEYPYVSWLEHYQNHPNEMATHLAVYERFGRRI